MTGHTGRRRTAVFLDRDGVLNRSDVVNGKPYAPRKLEDFHLFPDAALAVGQLKQAGFAVIVVTNQPDIGNGLVTIETINAMHQRLAADVPVDEIMMCPHRQDEGCSCRKPKPGMIVDAIARWNIEPSGSIMVGDRWNDVVAGHSAGLYTIFIDRGYSESLKIQPDLTVASLGEAAEHILSQTSEMGNKR